jgi:hypothetical protein
LEDNSANSEEAEENDLHEETADDNILAHGRVCHIFHHYSST